MGAREQQLSHAVWEKTLDTGYKGWGRQELWADRNRAGCTQHGWKEPGTRRRVSGALGLAGCLRHTLPSCQLSAPPWMRTGLHWPRENSFHTRRTFLELPGVPRPEILQVFIQMRILGIIVLKWTLFTKFDPGKHWSRLGYLKTMLLFNVSFFIYLFLELASILYKTYAQST